MRVSQPKWQVQQNINNIICVCKGLKTLRKHVPAAVRLRISALLLPLKALNRVNYRSCLIILKFVNSNSKDGTIN